MSRNPCPSMSRSKGRKRHREARDWEERERESTERVVWARSAGRTTWIHTRRPMQQARRATWRRWFSFSLSRSTGHHRPCDEHQVCGTFGKPSHVPRKPLFTVADQHLHAMPLTGEADLL